MTLEPDDRVVALANFFFQVRLPPLPSRPYGRVFPGEGKISLLFFPRAPLTLGPGLNTARL